MAQRFFALIMALLLPICLSGCSFSDFEAQNLMSPPKANEDQQSIHKLLQGNRADITFVYPKSGDYRSAIIMQDFTGDGEKDAIGFYALEDKSLAVQFLIKAGGQWKTAATYTNPATQVDRVCFADLSGNGYQDVLIGWGSAAGTTGRTAAVTAYVFDDGDVAEHPLGTYGEMAVTDFDSNGIKEVFTIDKFVPAQEEGQDSSPALAKVYVLEDGKVIEHASTHADNSIANYSSLVFGNLTSGLEAVVVDGAKADGSMTTQVFFLEDKVLKNLPEGVNEEGYVNPFTRPSTAAFTSRDANSDGYLELPVVTLLPGIPSDITPDFTSYMVEWSSFNRDGVNYPVLRALLNPRENYWFRLPYNFLGKISASNDSAKRTVTYTQVVQSEEDGLQLLGAPLFAIRVFTKASWESRGESSGYEQLAAQSDLVYGIQILTSDETALLSINEIKRNFKLLTE